MPRRKLGRRDGNEMAIVETLRAVGCSVFQLDHPADLLVARAGVNYLLEVKDPFQPPSRRRLTDEERRFHTSWRGQVCVVETPTDALEAVGAVKPRSDR